MRIIAIDPGKNGGIAIDYSDGAQVYNMPPTVGDLKYFLVGDLTPNEFKVVIEEVGAYHGGNMGHSLAKLNRHMGQLEGVFQTLGFRVELVRPMKWQKALGLKKEKNMSNTNWKNKLKAMAQRLYPNLNITLRTADAVLILEYARRLNV